MENQRNKWKTIISNLAGNELINSAVIMRYFGNKTRNRWISFRAYGDSVKEVIKIVILKEYQKLINKTLICDYSELSKLGISFKSRNINIKSKKSLQIK